MNQNCNKEHSGTLIFFCGKMGAGKSTRAREIASQPGAVLLAEDEWLAVLYPEEISDFDDYLKYSARLKPLLENHVRELLDAGVVVVMDFPGNTPKQRAWFRKLTAGDAYPHKLIYLEADDALCLAQIRQRGEAEPARAKFDTEAMFHHVTSFFAAPSPEEGFNVQTERLLGVSGQQPGES